MVAIALEQASELNQMTAEPPPADSSICGAWWKGFYCLLQKGHDGPHEDTGTVKYVPGHGSSQSEPQVAYDIFWTVKED